MHTIIVQKQIAEYKGIKEILERGKDGGELHREKDYWIQVTANNSNWFKQSGIN